MTYILFFTIFYGNSGHTFTAEFHTKQYCEQAAAAHAAKIKPITYVATCNPKGLKQ